MAAKRFQCHFCDAQFNRSEHFKRHERSHPAHEMRLDTGEKPFTCTICGMSFVRNDLMLRHGRLKHKTNLRKPPPEKEPGPAQSPSIDDPHNVTSVTSVTSVLHDHFDSTSMDIEACFSALDPTMYAPWPLPDFNIRQPSILDPLPAFTIPNTPQLLQDNGFREVLVKAVQAMSQPPKIPSLSSLKRYVSLFIEKFLPNNPFLPPTFDIDSGNPLLLISMASVGALYGVERKTALMLHTVAKNIEENLRSVLGCEDYPVWAVQALYVNSTFAAWSGFAKGVQYAISRMPILGMLSKTIYHRLSIPMSALPQPKEWVELETLRRTYFCIYLFSGSITLIFAAPPVVTTVDARGLSLPCDSEEWTSNINAMTWRPPTSCRYDDAMMALWSGNPIRCSEFGVRILATSVFLEIWQAQHGHGPWLPENWQERHYIVLECLQKHIHTAYPTPAEDGDPLTWNAAFILCGCYARLASQSTFVEEAFYHCSGAAISQGLKLSYAHFDAAKIDLRSIRAALDGFMDVVRRGLKFISHTGCWSRGLEHALGGFHSGTLLIHWVRRIEETRNPTPEEAQLMGELRKLLEEGDVHIYPDSMAATLARSSIQLMEQVWIFGITPLMGEAFRLYAEDILGSRAAIMDVEPVLLEDEQTSEYGD